MHVLGWSSAAERFATACARIDAVRKREVYVIAEQRIGDLLVRDEKTGQYGTLREHAKQHAGAWSDLLSYLFLEGQRAPRFDFVVVGRPRWIKTSGGSHVRARPVLLAIEVDGTPHRYDGGMGTACKDVPGCNPLAVSPRRVRQADHAKDEVCERHGALVKVGNRRDTETTFAGCSFTLLRLPTDGSTAFETRELAGHAGPEVNETYVTIDELIEKANERLRNAANLIYVRDAQTATKSDTQTGWRETRPQTPLAPSADGKLSIRLPNRWGWWPTEEGIAYGLSALLHVDKYTKRPYFSCLSSQAATGSSQKTIQD